jgi:hypothetical protein
MNCPSRVDPEFPEGYNQNPNALNADATTRADLGFIGNAKARDDHTIDHLGVYEGTLSSQPEATDDGHAGNSKVSGLRRRSDVASGLKLQRAEERIGSSGILREMIVYMPSEEVSLLVQLRSFANTRHSLDLGSWLLLHTLIQVSPDAILLLNFITVMISIWSEHSADVDGRQETMRRTLLRAPPSNTNFFSSC